MKERIKLLIAFLCYGLGTLGWIYVGIWMVWNGPVHNLIAAQLSGQLSIGKIFIAVIQGFIFLSLAGGVWCVGYMLCFYFKDRAISGEKDKEEKEKTKTRKIN